MYTQYTSFFYDVYLNEPNVQLFPRFYHILSLESNALKGQMLVRHNNNIYMEKKYIVLFNVY